MYNQIHLTHTISGFRGHHIQLQYIPIDIISNLHSLDDHPTSPLPRPSRCRGAGHRTGASGATACADSGAATKVSMAQ